MFQGYYKRTDDYIPILNRKEKGCFKVVMLNSVYLIDLRRNASLHLYYDPTNSSYKGSIDDVMVFGHSVSEAGTDF